MNENGPAPSSDHDLLIRVDTKLGNVIDEIRLLRDGTERRIEGLEKGKLDKEEFITYKTEQEKDGEKTARGLADSMGAMVERQDAADVKLGKIALIVAAASGALAVLQFLAPVILRHFNL